MTDLAGGTPGVERSLSITTAIPNIELERAVRGFALLPLSWDIND